MLIGSTLDINYQIPRSARKTLVLADRPIDFGLNGGWVSASPRDALFTFARTQRDISKWFLSSQNLGGLHPEYWLAYRASGFLRRTATISVPYGELSRCCTGTARAPKTRLSQIDNNK
jgi:hypothetical protein